MLFEAASLRLCKASPACLINWQHCMLYSKLLDFFSSSVDHLIFSHNTSTELLKSTFNWTSSNWPTNGVVPVETCVVILWVTGRFGWPVGGWLVCRWVVPGSGCMKERLSSSSAVLPSNIWDRAASAERTKKKRQVNVKFNTRQSRVLLIWKLSYIKKSLFSSCEVRFKSSHVP